MKLFILACTFIVPAAAWADFNDELCNDNASLAACGVAAVNWDAKPREFETRFSDHFKNRSVGEYGFYVSFLNEMITEDNPYYYHPVGEFSVTTAMDEEDCLVTRITTPALTPSAPIFVCKPLAERAAVAVAQVSWRTWRSDSKIEVKKSRQISATSKKEVYSVSVAMLPKEGVDVKLSKGKFKVTVAKHPSDGRCVVTEVLKK